MFEHLNPLSEIANFLTPRQDAPRPNVPGQGAFEGGDAMASRLVDQGQSLLGAPGRIAANLSAAAAPGTAQLGARAADLSPIAPRGFGMAPTDAPPVRTVADDTRSDALGEAAGEIGMLAAGVHPLGAGAMGLVAAVPAARALSQARDPRALGTAGADLLASLPLLAHGLGGLRGGGAALPERAAPPLQITAETPYGMAGGLPPEPGFGVPPPDAVSGLMNSNPQPVGPLPPAAERPALPSAQGYNDQPFTDPSQLLPPGTDAARVPHEVTIDPRTGEITREVRGATGETIRPPPGGFGYQPPAPVQLPVVPAIGPTDMPVFDRRASSAPDAVGIAPPPGYPPLAGEAGPGMLASRQGAVDLSQPQGPRSSPDLSNVNTADLFDKPAPAIRLGGPPEPPLRAQPAGPGGDLPVIDGEFERVPRPPGAPDLQTPAPPPAPDTSRAWPQREAPVQRARMVRYADSPQGYDDALARSTAEPSDTAPAPPPPPTPAAAAPKKDEQAAAAPIWPDLPEQSTADRELAAPGRHVNARDAALTRSTAVGNILGPTEKRMAGSGAPIKERTGGTGLADVFAEGTARADQRAKGFTDNVLQGVDAKFPEGSAGDLAAARWIEGKATPEDLQLLQQNPDLQAAAERWQRGAQEAATDPRFEIKGHLDNYLTHARAKGQPATLMDFIHELERGSSNPALRDNPLTSYMQRSRGGATDAPPSLVRAARAYGKAGGFQMDLKPLLKQAAEFTQSTAPDGSPVFDAADREFITTWINDAVMGREQMSDALARRTPGISHATALLNKGLSTVGLPTIDNPLKSAANAGRALANITLVRPAAAAISHFLGDVWPKIAEKGTAGIGEYVTGARQAMMSMSDAEWSRLERLGVAKRLPKSESAIPGWQQLGTAAKRTLGAVNTVDTMSKVGTFYTEFERLVGTGMSEAEAESKAATLTRARNYYSNAVNSIPLSTGRVAGTFYQFLKPGLNGLDNLRNWAVQGNAGAYLRTGLGVAGLYALGQATDTDFMHRVHLLPHDLKPAMLSPKSTPALMNMSDPFGLDTQEDLQAQRKESNRAGFRARQRRKKE